MRGPHVWTGPPAVAAVFCAMSTALRTPPQNPMCLATMIFNEAPPDAAARPRPFLPRRPRHIMISGLAGPGEQPADHAHVEASQGIDLVAVGPGMDRSAVRAVHANRRPDTNADRSAGQTMRA